MSSQVTTSGCFLKKVESAGVNFLISDAIYLTFGADFPRFYKRICLKEMKDVPIKPCFDCFC